LGKLIKDNHILGHMAKINVEVPDHVAIAFRKYVVGKYGSMRGMGKEVDEALRTHLAKNNIRIET
jgi:hypothetical protein